MLHVCRWLPVRGDMRAAREILWLLTCPCLW